MGIILSGHRYILASVYLTYILIRMRIHHRCMIIWSSGSLIIGNFRYRAILTRTYLGVVQIDLAIWTSNYLDIELSGYQIIWTSGYLGIRLFGHRYVWPLVRVNDPSGHGIRSYRRNYSGIVWLTDLGIGPSDCHSICRSIVQGNDETALCPDS